MYSGLIQDTGRLVAESTHGDFMQWQIQPQQLAIDLLAIGGSCAVNGICLTRIQKSPGWWFESSPETQLKTTVTQWKVGDFVNLELALQVGSPLGGHLGYGVVDGVGTIEQVLPGEVGKQFWISLPDAVAPMVSEQGPITVDGISLTVVEKKQNSIRLQLIPHTLEVTNSQYWGLKQPVNIEIDAISRQVWSAVHRILHPPSSLV